MHNPTFSEYGPYVVIVTGVSLHMMIYALALNFMQASSNLLFLLPGIGAAFLCGLWAGSIRATRIRWISYPTWGLLFGLFSGIAGTVLCFRFAVPGCTNLHQFFTSSWENALIFLIVIPFAFIAGAFGSDRIPRKTYLKNTHQNQRQPQPVVQNSQTQPGTAPTSLTLNERLQLIATILTSMVANIVTIGVAIFQWKVSP